MQLDDELIGPGISRLAGEISHWQGKLTEPHWKFGRDNNVTHMRLIAQMPCKFQTKLETHDSNSETKRKRC